MGGEDSFSVHKNDVLRTSRRLLSKAGVPTVGEETAWLKIPFESKEFRELRLETPFHSKEFRRAILPQTPFQSKEPGAVACPGRVVTDTVLSEVESRNAGDRVRGVITTE